MKKPKHWTRALDAKEDALIKKLDKKIAELRIKAKTKNLASAASQKLRDQITLLVKERYRIQNRAHNRNKRKLAA